MSSVSQKEMRKNMGLRKYQMKTEKFPNMVKGINPQIHEAKWIMSNVNPKKSTPWNITVNLLKTKDIRKSWKR